MSNSGCSVFFIGSLCALFLQGTLLPATLAAPYTPASNQVIRELPRSVISLRRSIQNQEFSTTDTVAGIDAQNISQAAKFLDLAYRNNDSRGFGIAKTHLKKWWHQDAVPPQVGLMKAVIQQHDHQFVQAIATLTKVLTLAPDNGQALLYRAQSYLTNGQLAAAKSDCKQLAFNVSTAIAVNCLAQVNSVTGQAVNSYELLTQLSNHENYLNEQELQEITISRADIAHRLGYIKAAESAYQQALHTSPGNTYVLTHYADLLIEQNRYRQLITLFEGITPAQYSLDMEIRLLEAYKILRIDSDVERDTGNQLESNATNEKIKNDYSRKADTLEAYLTEKFNQAATRNELFPHKEYARFILVNTQYSNKALTSALANWNYQKEPSDALLVAQAAIAANDSLSLRMITDWIEQTGLEDIRLTGLLDN